MGSARDAPGLAWDHSRFYGNDGGGCRPEEELEPHKETPTVELDYDYLAIGKCQGLPSVTSVRTTTENGPKLGKDNTAKLHRIIRTRGHF